MVWFLGLIVWLSKFTNDSFRACFGEETSLDASKLAVVDQAGFVYYFH